MKIPINIELDDKNPSVCGQDCPFRCSNDCILFNANLVEISLEKGWKYQSNSNVPRFRCWKCRSIIGELPNEND